MTAYREGYEAYFSGWDVDDNPFYDDFTSLGYEDFMDLEEGWWDAYDDDRY